jgi:hypothetical protein
VPIKRIIFLFGISLYSTASAELLAEVELFKTSIVLKFARGRTLTLLAAGLFVERFVAAPCACSARRLRFQSLMQLNIRPPAWYILFRTCKRGGYHDSAFPIWCRQWSAIGG